jgi:hypothetical protein
MDQSIKYDPAAEERVSSKLREREMSVKIGRIANSELRIAICDFRFVICDLRFVNLEG